MNKYYNIAKNELFSICRSITGNGIKKTLRIIKKNFPRLKIVKFQSGMKVFDWIVPDEWNIYDAYVKDKNNNKIIDFKKNNLHLVSFSTPVNKIISKNELLNHLNTLPKKKKLIPYVTSYYKKRWGFCSTEIFKRKLIKDYRNNDKFKVRVDSEFKKKGNLVYGEYIIPGKSKKEILISTYICHPSMANNELSGPIVSMSLINYFKRKKNQKTLRFIFIPETIGSICFLHKNLEFLKKYCIGGFNLTCIGDERSYSYMPSLFEESASDNSVKEAFKKLKINYKKYNFIKDRGSDERQYCSPGVDLPIASIFRSKYYKFPEYHTSADNFTLVTKKGIKGGFRIAKTAIEILLKKEIPLINKPCEPFLSRINIRGKFNKKDILDFLVFCNGKNDLTTISKKIKINIKKIYRIYNFLIKKKIII